MENGINIFNSISEFKYFFDKELYQLPKIYKDSKLITVDLSLFYEIFFIGQDNRASSNLISKGRFNKIDFKNMIFSFFNIPIPEILRIDNDKIKQSLENKKSALKIATKKIKIIKSNTNIARVVSSTYDNIDIKNKKERLKNFHLELSELKKSRIREINRQEKLKNLIAELNSLNRNLSEGHVICSECGSDKITYNNDNISFDISNLDVRNSILQSIRNNIDQKSEIINEIQDNINQIQNIISSEINSTPESLINILVYKDIIDDGYQHEKDANILQKEINILNIEMNQSNINVDNSLINKSKTMEEIIQEMNKLLHELDPDSSIIFNDIFTKRDLVFSGSEEQEFYFCKIIALNNILKHKFPLIIDSFRDGELSTDKEKKC